SLAEMAAAFFELLGRESPFGVSPRQEIERALDWNRPRPTLGEEEEGGGQADPEEHPSRMHQPHPTAAVQRPHPFGSVHGLNLRLIVLSHSRQHRATGCDLSPYTPCTYLQGFVVHCLFIESVRQGHPARDGSKILVGK